MIYIEDLKKSPDMYSGNPDDGWVKSRPYKPCFILRVRDAWQVLVGKADAIKWYRQ